MGGGCAGSNDIGIDMLFASVIGKETVFGFINIVEGVWKNWTGCWGRFTDGIVNCGCCCCCGGSEGSEGGGAGCEIVVVFSRGSSSSLSEP